MTEQIKQPEEIKKDENINSQIEEKAGLDLVGKKEGNKEKIEEQEKQQIESLHKRITEKYKKDDVGQVSLTLKQKELISEMASESEKRLKENYEPGFGISPSTNPNSNFFKQVWTRDLGHAAGNFFAHENPQALLDSFSTVLKNQRENGMLPYRTEKVYALVQYTPLRFLAKPLFDLIQKKIKGKDVRPRYEGQDFSSAQDTVPTTICGIGEFFINSQEGKEFVEEHFDQLKKSIDFFRGKADPEDGLISVKKGNADWADSINRQGKLGNINVLWARSLRMMEFMARNIGKNEDAEKYQEEFRKVKSSLMEKIYNKDEGYFRAAEGEDRIDTVASIFGSLYFLNSDEAVKVQDTMKRRLKTPSGLKNFDPPYPKNQIMRINRVTGNGGYHNEDVWPWVTCQNIQVKIKIGLNHPDTNIRKQYKEEAVNDLIDMADLFKKAGGAYEIFRPNDRSPTIKSLYTPPQNLMGNLAAYQGAYSQLKELGWI